MSTAAVTGLCEHCTQGYILPGEFKGSIQSNNAYLAAGPTTQEGPKKAVVLLTDIFGLPLKNCKIVADKFAELLGCDVWVPDMFAGTPPVKVGQLDALPDEPKKSVPFMGKLHLFWVILTRFPFLIVNRPSVVDARVKAFVESIKKDHGYEKIGAVGYVYLCFAIVFSSH